MGATQDMGEPVEPAPPADRITVDGLVEGEVEAATLVVRDGDGKLRLLGPDRRLGAVVVEHHRGTFRQLDDGRIWRPSSVLAVVTDGDGQDQVAVGVE